MSKIQGLSGEFESLWRRMIGKHQLWALDLGLWTTGSFGYTSVGYQEWSWQLNFCRAENECRLTKKR